MKSVLTAENLLYMFNGMKLTLAIAACASVIAILFGTLLALAKTYCKGKLGFLNNVSHGQFEAGYSQGYSFLKILQFIILPQAFRAVIPSMMSQVVSIIKSTSLLASINIFEYLFTCNTVMVSSTSLSGIFTVYVMEAAGYFIVCYLLVLLVKIAGRKLKYA